jgi:BirA family biotin operon repressor/biotin-[acetyl-CoA-carboxylase] ligase
MALDGVRLRGLLPAQGFWCKVHVFRTLGSSNELLKKWAERGAPEGTVVIAEEQFAARGRLGRAWQAPPGGAWFSILLRPPGALGQAGCIAMALAVGLTNGLREAFAVPVGIKWPNDLWVGGKKLGGMLIELASRGEGLDWLIAGIGLNVNNPLPSGTRSPATSLSLEAGRPIAWDAFYHVALSSLAEGYRTLLREGFAPVREAWRDLSVLGERVDVQRGSQIFQADVIGLSDSGKLLVRTQEGLSELAAEEVSVLV